MSESLPAARSPEPVQDVVAVPIPPRPFDEVELDALVRTPFRFVDVLLGTPRRIAESPALSTRRAAIALVLLAGTVVLALPYGWVLGVEHTWRVPALLLGTLAICFPSLHVFGAYVGRTMPLLDHVVLALVIPCVAAVFTFAFFPIVWLLSATTNVDGPIGGRDLSSALLVVALLAGMLQLWRCLPTARQELTDSLVFVVLLAWNVLFLFVSRRLALVLGLA